MEVKRDPSNRVFEYKLVMELEQPMHEAIAHFEEMDLVHKVQKQLSKPLQAFGPLTPWQKVYMMCINVAIFKLELVTATCHAFGCLCHLRDLRNSSATEGRRTLEQCYTMLNTVKQC